MDRRLTLIGVLSTITMLSTIAAFSAADDKKEINVEKLTESLDMKKRKAIVDAANRASHQHMVDREKGPPSNEIAESSWGEAISELKPLRVRFDRVNVAIVLREDENTEEGLYISVPTSSYAPREKDFLLWKKLTKEDDRSFGHLILYKMAKRAAGSGQ